MALSLLGKQSWAQAGRTRAGSWLARDENPEKFTGENREV